MNIFLDSYGCTANQADAQIIRGILSGHEFTDLEKCDVVILNSCAVKNSTENRMFSRIEKYQQAGKKVIVAGCLPAINPKRLSNFDVQSVDTNSLPDLPKMIENSKSYFSHKHKNKLKMPYHQDDSETGIVMISEGCLGNCYFCGVKNARGNLTSYQAENVVNFVKNLVELGKKRILLTSQDNGCYGLDINTNLAELLRKIIEIPADFKIRVGMMNPFYAYKMLDDLIEIYKNEKIIKFLHIPIQSGSDKVLKAMNRVGNVEQFEQIVQRFRKEIPDTYISTDVIVGFPAEKDDDFELTAELIEKTKPDKVNISKFYPRPKTEATSMPKLRSQVVAARSAKMSKICRKKH